LRVPPQEVPIDRPVQSLVALEPQYRERVWGGDRLRRSDPPTGEAWVAFGGSRVTSGPAGGATVDRLAAEHGTALLGEPVVTRSGARFPLIVKLLDTADWLSVQVHPDDDQARAMVGPTENGKTEAWYFVEAPDDARILAGIRPGITRPALQAAIRSGRILDVAAEVPVVAGSSILIPSGTLHSLGPGLLVCEVQQASDITFRAWDWNRPQSGGRRLNVEESIAVVRTAGPCERHEPASGHRTGVAGAESCRYFEMDLATVATGEPLEADTSAVSFHSLTVIEGTADIACGTESLRLGRFETGLVAAAAGRYRVTASGGRATLLRASVPGPRPG
jgi:mannose-6-phosphate isomerase